MTSTPFQPSRRRRRSIAVAFLTGLAVIAAACGSDDSATTATTGVTTGATTAATTGATTAATTGATTAPTDSTGATDSVAEANAALDAARAAPQDFGTPGPVFDVAAAKGKTLYYIVNGLDIPFVAELADNVTAALGEVGVKVVVVDGKNVVQDTARLVEQAVGQKADIIAFNSLPAAQIAQSLLKAKEANIPVISLFQRDPGPLPDADAQLGVVVDVSYCTACVGNLQADWVYVDSAGKANAKVITNSAIGLAEPQTVAFGEKLDRLCGSDCKHETLDVIHPGNWATDLPTMTASALRDPDVGYLLPTYEDMSLFMSPSVASAGAAARVKIVTFNANTTIMQRLAAGTDSIAADMGYSTAWTAWTLADNVLRVLTGNTPVVDYKLPLRLFDATNITSIDVSKPQESWFEVDFRAGFRKLWGLS